MISPVLSRGIGYGLGTAAGGAAAAVSWWLSGGVSASNAVAVYQPIGAASLAASYINLANPGTYNAAPGVAPSWASATGWGFDGSTQYLTTGVTVNANTWSMIVRFSGGITTGDRCLCGNYQALATKDFSLWQITAGKTYYINNALLASANYITAGILAMAGKKAYKNGNDDGTIPVGEVTSAPVGVGRAGSGGYYFFGQIQGFAIYNATLTAPQVAAISAAMAALTG